MILDEIVIFVKLLAFLDALRHEHARRLGERNLRGEVALGSLHSLQLDLKILLLELTVEGSQDRRFWT